MNINNQTPGTSTYKCDGCCNKIPTGTEKPRWTNDATRVYKLLFCRSCERGHELSEPYNLGSESMKITESSEFKRWNKNTLPFGDAKEAKELEKELERVRWGLPRMNEKG